MRTHGASSMITLLPRSRGLPGNGPRGVRGARSCHLATCRAPGLRPRPPSSPTGSFRAVMFQGLCLPHVDSPADAFPTQAPSASLPHPAPSLLLPHTHTMNELECVCTWACALESCHL